MIAYNQQPKDLLPSLKLPKITSPPIMPYEKSIIHSPEIQESSDDMMFHP